MHRSLQWKSLALPTFLNIHTSDLQLQTLVLGQCRPPAASVDKLVAEKKEEEEMTVKMILTADCQKEMSLFFQRPPRSSRSSSTWLFSEAVPGSNQPCLLPLLAINLLLILLPWFLCVCPPSVTTGPFSFFHTFYVISARPWYVATGEYITQCWQELVLFLALRLMSASQAGCCYYSRLHMWKLKHMKLK